MLVLFAHGFLPGLLNDGPWGYLLEGDMRCLHEMGLGALTSWCDAYGAPRGYPFLSTGPFAFAGWALMGTLGVGSATAYVITGMLFDAVALAGGYGLMRVLGSGRVVAFGTAIAYLLAPSVIGMRPFGGTFTGFALLPTYALADLLVMRALSRERPRLLALALAAYVALRTGALFLDGYSFVASALVGGTLWLQWLIAAPAPTRRKLLGAATALGAQCVAVAAYSLYAPRVAVDPPLELFRAMGLDLVTLVLPTASQWGADALGAAWDPSHLWGDQSNALYNYVGVVCLGLAVAGLVWRRREPYVAALAVAGAVALVLSLGPSLKLDDGRPPLPDQITYESYLMPGEAATVSLPWGGAFTALPGLDQMRASYRWSVVTRFALVVLAGLAIDALLRRRRRSATALALLLAALAVLELAPNLPALYDDQRAYAQSRDRLTAAVVPDLVAATADGERAFFLSPDGEHTDYLANYLAASTGVRAFNAGGDKNALLARAAWPPAVAALATPPPSADAVHAALASGAVDVVVAPSFHLRWAAYEWPPSARERAAAQRAFAPLLDDPRFAVRRYLWFATVRSSR